MVRRCNLHCQVTRSVLPLPPPMANPEEDVGMYVIEGGFWWILVEIWRVLEGGGWWSAKVCTRHTPLSHTPRHTPPGQLVVGRVVTDKVKTQTKFVGSVFGGGWGVCDGPV